MDRKIIDKIDREKYEKFISKTKNRKIKKENYHSFLTNHFDYGYFYSMIEWKLEEMRKFFLNNDRCMKSSERCKEISDQIAEAEKFVNILVNYSKDPPLAKLFSNNNEQEDNFTRALDSLVAILKKYSREWWD
jgi:hypothetical protein